MTFVIGTPHRHGAGHLDCHTGGTHSRHVEADIQTCTHCQKVIYLSEWRQNGAWCGKCMAPVCAEGPCAVATEKYGCLPWMKRLEQYFACEGKLAAFRRLAGLEP